MGRNLTTFVYNRSMEKKKSNCIGYAYHELGITSTEEPKYLPDLNDVLRSFDRVETINDADVMAVGFLSSIGNDLIVIHMAVVGDDKRSVNHRKWEGEPVTCDGVENIMAEYKSTFGSENVSFIFLKRKKLQTQFAFTKVSER